MDADCESTAVSLPITEEKVRRLHIGDFLLLSGELFTARDAVHRYLFQGGEVSFSLDGAVLFHCGPVARKSAGEWSIVAAGPTTSIREERYMPRIIRRFGIRGIIGKGGMGADTLAECARSGCVYMQTVGGAAQVLAERITAVSDVYLREQFGSPEAVWEFTVEDFPVIVTMDSHGNSLHGDVLDASQVILERLFSGDHDRHVVSQFEH